MPTWYYIGIIDLFSAQKGEFRARQEMDKKNPARIRSQRGNEKSINRYLL